MMTFYTLFLLFISCSFVGWILECLLLLYEEKRFINRGFLTGPICPLYGIGSLTILLLFGNTNLSIVPLFFLITLVCGSIEYFTSYLMEKIFNTRWWDYSKERFNLNGRLNLYTLIAFGLIGLFFIYVYLPFFNKVISLIPSTIIVIVSSIMILFFSIDLIISYLVAIEFKNDSIHFAKNLTEVDSTELIFKFKERILNENKAYKRLINAFPTVRFNVLDDIKNIIKKKIPKN